MRQRSLGAPMLFGLGCFVACAASTAQPPPRKISSSGSKVAQPAEAVSAPRVPFATVERMLLRDCGACHNEAGASNAGGLSLDRGKAYSALVARKSSEAPLFLVQAGAPDRSYLLAKMEGWHLRAGGSGEPMPLGQGRLPASKITLVRTWIAQGAKPN